MPLSLHFTVKSKQTYQLHNIVMTETKLLQVAVFIIENKVELEDQKHFDYCFSIDIGI